jgi:hypothetical protein
MNNNKNIIGEMINIKEWIEQRVCIAPSQRQKDNYVVGCGFGNSDNEKSFSDDENNLIDGGTPSDLLGQK